MQCDGANLDTLLKPRGKIAGDYWQFKCDLRAAVPDQWLFKPRGCGWKRPTSLTVFVELRTRLITALNTRFDRLQPDCCSDHTVCAAEKVSLIRSRRHAL